MDLEVARDCSAQCPRTGDKFVACRRFFDFEGAFADDVNRDIIASLRSRARTTLAGRRTAKLLPHFAIFIAPFVIDLVYI